VAGTASGRYLGAGGVGKSTIALAAAQAARDRGWRVWWVNAADAASLAGGMLETLQQLHAPEVVTQAVRENAPAAPGTSSTAPTRPGRTG
jgi:Mrp family chromosome partitioning ATPase